MDKEEKIRTSLNEMDAEILKDAMSILLSSNTSTVNQSESIQMKSDYKNFAQAILDLKKKFKFPELNFFTTEADLVYVQAGDRKILLTDRETMYQQKNPAPNINQNTPSSSQSQNSSNNSYEDEPKSDSEENEMENAFENIKPSDTRFSHLEF